jgi:hypothetical protein
MLRCDVLGSEECSPEPGLPMNMPCFFRWVFDLPGLDQIYTQPETDPGNLERRVDAAV